MPVLKRRLKRHSKSIKAKQLKISIHNPRDLAGVLAALGARTFGDALKSVLGSKYILSVLILFWQDIFSALRYAYKYVCIHGYLPNRYNSYGLVHTYFSVFLVRDICQMCEWSNSPNTWYTTSRFLRYQILSSVIACYLIAACTDVTVYPYETTLSSPNPYPK